jgi:hypothetical protein
MLLQNSADFGKCTVQRYRYNDAANSAVCNYLALLPSVAINSEELILKMYLPFKACQELRVPPGLTLKNCTC